MRVPIPGGYFCEALPSGECAVLMPTGVQTHDRFIHSDNGALPLYVRVTNVGGFKLAGQASDGGGTLIWNGAWQRDSRIATGSSGCIFDRDGNLHIIEPGEGVTSQGYRYVAPGGRLVLGDDTYGPLHGLSEWTDLGDGILIGQGNPGGGIRVWDGSALRELEPGPCRFIRVNRSGDDLAIATWKEGSGAVLFWLPVSDMLTLPLVDSEPSEPVSDPIPEPIPMPEIPDQTATVAAVRSQYPTPLGTLHGACLIAIARAIGRGAGLLRKESGTFVSLPDGAKVSQDIICFPDGTIYDCLSDAEGDARPSWSLASGGPLPARYYPVSGGDNPDPGDEDPAPVPSPVPTELVKRVEHLEKQMERLHRAGLLVATVYRP